MFEQFGCEYMSPTPEFSEKKSLYEDTGRADLIAGTVLTWFFILHRAIILQPFMSI